MRKGRVVESDKADKRKIDEYFFSVHLELKIWAVERTIQVPMGALILSLARRLASADMPTGPTLAACGDEIARNVAFTAPLRAAVVESRSSDTLAFAGTSMGCVVPLWVRCTIHGCRRI